MKIGEFSRQCGVSVRMLRFYETAGLLMPRRTAQGWREYDAAGMRRLSAKPRNSTARACR